MKALIRWLFGKTPGQLRKEPGTYRFFITEPPTTGTEYTFTVKNCRSEKEALAKLYYRFFAGDHDENSELYPFLDDIVWDVKDFVKMFEPVVSNLPYIFVKHMLRHNMNEKERAKLDHTIGQAVELLKEIVAAKRSSPGS